MPRLPSVLWELPQDLLGAAAFAKEALAGWIVAIEVEDGRRVAESTGTGVSLGHFVLRARRGERWHLVDERGGAHEVGHAEQSALLGPLDLPVVGAPSAGRACSAVVLRAPSGERWAREDGSSERWAREEGGSSERWTDAVGGVDRSIAPRRRGTSEQAA